MFDLISRNQNLLYFIHHPFRGCSSSISFNARDASETFRHKIEEALYINNIMQGMERTLAFNYASQILILIKCMTPEHCSENLPYELVLKPEGLYKILLKKIFDVLNRVLEILTLKMN